MTLDEKKDLLKLAIKRVIGGEQHVKFPMIGLHEVDKIMRDEGYEERQVDEELYCGWEGDFWFKWRHPNGYLLCVSGGVWQFGDTYNLYKDEEDTIEEGK